MATYQLYTEQHIPASLDEVWDFISSPNNLSTITPDSTGFEVRTKNLPTKMYEGLMITYKVRPLAGIPTSWVTEITHVKDQQYFVDEQRHGPYKIWHHEHWVEEVEGGGVLMKDLITYQPPFGFLGAIANKILIKRKLRQIFDYRKKALIQIFGD